MSDFYGSQRGTGPSGLLSVVRFKGVNMSPLPSFWHLTVSASWKKLCSELCIAHQALYLQVEPMFKFIQSAFPSIQLIVVILGGKTPIYGKSGGRKSSLSWQWVSF